ncbi:MAG: glycosyltransferase [Jejuia sp.]
MRIFFICPDSNKAAGGIKQIYRQVDVLNKNEISAYVLHESPFFRCTWFPNTTKIVYSKNTFAAIRGNHKNFKTLTWLEKLKKWCITLVQFFKNYGKQKHAKLSLQKKDILVFPEIFAFAAVKVHPETKKVVYNQNCYYTYTNLDINSIPDLPYLHENTLATIVASENAMDYMRYVFKGITLYRVCYGMDHSTFKYTRNKKKIISFMPRKLREDVLQVIHIIKQKEISANWEFREIDNMSESQVAAVLGASTFFLSFNHREGFGMPPVEAMACGCVVIGYTGQGGKEYFKKEFSYEIPDSDVQMFAKTLEELMIAYETNSSVFIEKGKKASDFVASEYAMAVEEETIVSTWQDILKNI